ncbi:hypothetical protein Tco_1111544 [Tanacetum coccineum]|uniref:Uncharacterized protein n=1 Tax=Tanacetum coccineum TaxID=301880 RepID=A0ABQ5IN66_9ASTR
MKAVKDKDALQKIVDSGTASSKNSFGASTDAYETRGSKEVIDIDVQTEEAAELMVVSSTTLTGATRQAAVSEKSADDIMTFRKELDALALKHLGPVHATTPTSTNPVNTG